MHELPSDVTLYKRTRVFTHDTLPAALLREHDTRAGVWGRIEVLEGSVLLRFLDEDGGVVRLTPERPGVVAPQQPHALELTGDALRLSVGFYRASG